MKKSNPWWWNKMDSLMMDYFLSEFSDPDDRLSCGPGPGEDIWKKFELLPTPPRSPSRPSSDEDDDELVLAADKPTLTLVSDLLDCPDLATWGLCPVTSTGLKNDLLHDCMWSGQCTDTCKRGHAAECAAGEPAPPPPEVAAAAVVKTEPGVKVAVPTPARALTPSPALPVDPCTMLPYTPLSDHSYHTQQLVSRFIQPCTPPVCDTPSDTEDDEIDVVTLPASVGLKTVKCEPLDTPSVSFRSKASEPTPSTSAPAKRRPAGRPPRVPPLRVVIPASVYASSKHKERRGPGRKRFQKRHGVTSSSSSANSGGWARRHYKRRFTPHHHHTQQHHHHQDRTVSCSSDSEDCVEKRSMHNSMERKRRDDLRFAFQTLREHVPELASNPKAPKVLILNRAASYARQLSQTGAALEKTLKQETLRRRELQRKLMQLSKLK